MSQTYCVTHRDSEDLRTQWDNREVIHQEYNSVTKKLEVIIQHKTSLPNT